MDATWDNFKTWYRRPFSADMSVAEWFLFLGLLFVLVALWKILFMHIEEGLE